MLQHILISSAFITILATNAELFDPYVQGPHQVIYKRYKTNETGLEKTLDVWAPKEEGVYPTIMFSGSNAATFPGKGTVDTVVQRIASWGFAVVAPWQVLLAPDFHTNFIDPVVDYLESRMATDWIDQGASTNFSVDFSRMILMGHSAGNHINVNYLRNQCGRFVAVVLLSPVDGADNYGIIDDFCITPGQKLNFSIPTLTMQAGLDPVKGNILYPACAPAKLSNRRFYDAMSGDKWFVNASAYGHADFFEPEFVGAVDFLNFCATDSETDKNVYRDFVGGSVVAFSKAMLNPEKFCDMLRYIEEPSRMPIVVSLDQNTDTRCQPSQCKFIPAA